MACPNIAGVALLLRQYVVENFTDISDDHVAVNHMINRLMMSTADILRGKNGLPYAVRKQGAGLANLQNCIDTTALILTYDEDGKAMDKSKLELGDDPSKTGVYEMTFGVQNFGSSSLSYDIGAYIMTEGVSETLTNAGETTVTETGYLLEGAKLEIVEVTGGSVKGMNLTVAGGSEAKVTVKITLSDADKKYMNDSFENGMYVEGFITLTATAGTKVNLNVPYLAFYGDWTKAPLFDLDYFETDADERDDSIPMADKTLADAYATRPIGGVSSDYVSYLGSYYFVQDPEDMIISANRDYIALSNQEGTIHSLSFVWAGLLRNAEKIVITITDDTTGEVVYETVDDQIRKSYGDGGTIRPANVEIEFDTMDYNLMNNSEYTVKLVGYLDYGNGGLETNENNTFEFPLTIDFQAPTVEGVEFYYKYDKTLKKNRLFAKIAVYDNHYTMSMQLGYAYYNSDGQVDLKSFEQYLTPVYSQKDSTTYVEYELTDYVYEIANNSINPNSFVVTCYDYALNYAIYDIGMPANFKDFYFESIPEEGLTLNPNEVYSMAPSVYPDTEWAELLEYTSSRTSVVRVVNNELVAVAPGKANIRVRDPQTNESVTFQVTVRGEGDEGYRRLDKPVAANFELVGYQTIKAYFQLSSEDKDLGNTGDVRYFEGKTSLSMYPSESVMLNYRLDAYFPQNTTVEFVSNNENIVRIDESGIITAVAEGYSSVTMKVKLDGKNTTYTKTVSIEVKDPFINTGASLTHYFGNGGVVIIPKSLSLTSIGSFAFSNYDYVAKTPEELEFDDSSQTKQWYIGDNTITEVHIPEGVKRIDPYAFAGLTALKTVYLPSTLTEISYGAFYNCTSLTEIKWSGENNLKIINKSAFEGCNLTGTLDLPSAYVIGDYAFAGNVNLEGIHLPETLQSVGSYAFGGCAKLSDVQVTAHNVKYGSYAFTGCTALKEFTVNASVIPAGMFYQCTALEKVIIGDAVNGIYEYAFRATGVKTFEIESGNTAFKTASEKVIVSADGTTLIAVAPVVTGTLNADAIGGANVTTIGRGAVSHNSRITAVELPNVTYVDDYGFASADRVTSVTLGRLTHIGDYSFSETKIKEMPSFDAATHIGRYAFLKSGLTSVTIPDGMEISEGAFSRCLDLQKIVIGNGVILGDYAFFQDKDDNFIIDKSNEFTGGKENVFFYVFDSNLKELTIGADVTIGSNAFANAFKLETVTLGENAIIGEMAFYNNESLKNIDLSKALSIGDYAFSGDVYYMYLDQDRTVPAFNTEGRYLFTYHAPELTKVDLTSADGVGDYAFAYCHELKEVVLGPAVSKIGEYAFSYTIALKNINLSEVISVGAYAFMDSAIVSADLRKAVELGEYAFVQCLDLKDLVLNPASTNMGEGAFAYCAGLTSVGNLEFAQQIGNYAFAYTGITDADLSGAVSIGDAAFLKDERGTFRVELGNALVELGDNPFAGSVLEPFSKTEEVEFNGTKYPHVIYTFDLSDTVKVIDGSLYFVVDNGGLELTTYAGLDHTDVKVADNTVRISSMAFTNSDVQMVTLPHTVKSIGHKAFFGCQKLGIVVFTSYEAPTLEEEFDKARYDSYEHIPGTGDYGTYADYDGTDVTITGNGQIPYFMWNATGGLYSNIFYGANFLDYVGYVEDKILMVRPSNGQQYETYMFGQYFNLVVDGSAAMDDATLGFVAAMNKLPERVSLNDEHLVVAARAAYNKIATTLQKGLVESLYTRMVAAEQRIQQLKEGAGGGNGGGDVIEKPDSNVGLYIAIAVIVLLIVASAAAVILLLKKKPVAAAAAEEIPAAEAAAAAAVAAEATAAETAEEPAQEAPSQTDEETTTE